MVPRIARFESGASFSSRASWMASWRLLFWVVDVSSLRNEERELANVAGALCFALHVSASDSELLLPPVEVSEEVMSSLCTAQSALLAAGLFSVLVGFRQFKAFLETNLLESVSFLNLFSSSVTQHGDAAYVCCWLLLIFLWSQSSCPFLVNGHPLIGLLISEHSIREFTCREKGSGHLGVSRAGRAKHAIFLSGRACRCTAKCARGRAPYLWLCFSRKRICSGCCN